MIGKFCIEGFWPYGVFSQIADEGLVRKNSWTLVIVKNDENRSTTMTF